MIAKEHWLIESTIVMQVALGQIHKHALEKMSFLPQKRQNGEDPEEM